MSAASSSGVKGNKHKTQHSHLSKVTPFQLELNKVEKKLAEKFQRYIDSKLKSCSNGNVDNLVLVDIATEIKTNTAESLKMYLKNYSKTCGNGDDNFRESIEQIVAEKVEADIERSFKDIGEILFVAKDEDVVVESNEANENESVPSCSIKTTEFISEDHSFENEQSTDVPNISSAIAAGRHISMNTPQGKNDEDISTSSMKNLESLQKNAVENVQKIKNDCDVVTYTRRQINPENISDALSDNHSEADCPSPQIISKTIESISMQKYETVEKKQPDIANNLQNLVKNTKASSLKQESRAKLSGSSLKKEKSYSFFENYLRRKKERQSLTSTKNRDSQIQRQSKEMMSPNNKEVDNIRDENSESIDSNDIILESNELDQNDDSNSSYPEPIDFNSLQKLDEANRANDEEVLFSIDPNSSKKNEDLHNGTDCDLESNITNIARLNSTGTGDFPLDNSSCSDPSKIPCDKCNLLIDINEMQEHQDYHFALELSNSASPSSAQNNFVRESASSSSSKILNKKSSKRGRPSKLNSFKNSDSFKKLKTIDAFFKPGNSSFS